MHNGNINRCLVALLIVGSAISLFSCKERETVATVVSTETLMSEMSDSLTVIVSENGRPSYRFFAPLVEGYSLAREPYREFRKGVNIITYVDDSMSMVDATLRANYAIYYSNLKLWEAKGDVVVVKQDGKELYTQQLFWNSTTKRIYSNVDTKIIDTTNDDVYIGEGFESDEEMKEWSFRKMKGTMKVDTTPTEPDTTAKAEPTETRSKSKSSTAAAAKPQEKPAEDEAVLRNQSPVGRGDDGDEQIDPSILGLPERPSADRSTKSRPSFQRSNVGQAPTRDRVAVPEANINDKQ